MKEVEKVPEKIPVLDDHALEILRPILDALPFYVLLVDEDHQILAVNQAVTHELDRLPRDLVGCRCPEAIHSEDKEYPGCPLEEAVEKGGVAVEKEFFDKEKGRWIESMIYPVDQGEEQARLFVHFVRDITETKRVQEIAASRERLARVGEFSARLAHTIRNPVHGLLNSMALLKKRFLGGDSEAQEILTWMDEGLSRLESVTRRMLTLTRETPLDRQHRELNNIVAEAVSMVQEQGQSGGPTVELDLGELPPISLDSERLGEVVINLLDNAVYACGGSGIVQVRTRALDGDGGKEPGGQCLEVQDSGPGIPQDLLDQVFDPFFTTKPVGEGTGLGLAIARRVISEHEGQMEILCDEGQGTLVRVILPSG